MKPTHKEDLKLEKRASLDSVASLSKCNLLFISTRKPGGHVIGCVEVVIMVVDCWGIMLAGLISLCGCGGVEAE